MKDIEPTTAELIAEWKELLDYNHHLRNDREDRFASLKDCRNSERINVIAAKLDKRCEQMLVINGALEVGVSEVSSLQHLTSPPKPIGYRFKIPLAELYARIEWLLIKEGVNV